MKKLMMLVLAGLFSTGVAVAGGGDKVDFSKLDQDGDGQLSRTEVAQNAELAAQFSTIDADGDGYLAQDEVQGAEVQQISQEKDQNKDSQSEDSMGEDY